MKIFGLNIGNISNSLEPKVIKKERDIRKKIQPNNYSYRVRQDIATWRNGVNQAESVLYPQRGSLLKTYKDVILDAHLSASIQQRKNLTLAKTFEVTVGERDDKELTKLVNTKWFRDFLDYSLDSLFWGHSLIQFDDVIDLGFKKVELVPREHVKPEFNLVVENPTDDEGEDYLESPYKEWCIGVGRPDDLGLLLKASPLVIWKKNALGAWAEFCEVFGVPIRIGKTDIRDEETRVNMELFLKGLGTSSYGVFDMADEIELVESSRTDAYEVFDKMIERCNSELSKLVLGQTATMDESAFVGSSEVQERALAKMSYTDQFFIGTVLNYQLVPLMQNLGLLPDNVTINVKAEDGLTLQAQAEIDVELLKTGRYKFTPEYLREKYGSDVIEVNMEDESLNLPDDPDETARTSIGTGGDRPPNADL